MNDYPTESEYLLDERAAILEYDGGMPRPRAEWYAKRLLTTDGGGGRMLGNDGDSQ